ncbi:MAG: EamA family transporter [Bacteriovoracia bacterium]
MQPKDLLLGLLVMAIWGFNFVAIRIGLHDIPPILLCALRFLLSALPAVFFFPRPKGSWSLLFGFAIFTFALQFSFLFVGMQLGMPAGLASLIGQFQVFFTMGLALWFFGEKPSRWKLSGAFISFLGILIVAANFHGSANLIGLMLSLLAALAWAFGNMYSKKISAQSSLALVVWGSLLASPFLIVLSLLVDGPAAIAAAFQHLTWTAAGAIAYIVYLSTYVGYSLWGYLLNRYPTATVAPFSLLVPVFGFLGAHFALGEEFPLWKLFASALVVLGLMFNLFEAKIRALLASFYSE